MFVTIKGEYEDYLRDESRLSGSAAAISFPSCEAELIADIRKAADSGIPITLQGARTGITAGAVPEEGFVINMSGMNRITGLRYDSDEDCFYLTAEPGLLLCDLRSTIETGSFNTGDWSSESLEALRLFKQKGLWFFPPDPTETTASLGGMAACNASGARTFYYGSVRRYIQALRAVLADGSLISLKRRNDCSHDGQFSIQKIPNLYTYEKCTDSKVQADLKANQEMARGGCTNETGTDNGNCLLSSDNSINAFHIEGSLPDYRAPQVKNASGYYIDKNMDLLDLFIGSEGTLGVISSLELKLIKLPAVIYGLMSFFSSEKLAIDYVNLIRSRLLPQATVVAQVTGINQNTKLSLSVDYSGDNSASNKVDNTVHNIVGNTSNKPADSAARLVAIEFFNHDALALLQKQKRINPAFSELPEVDSSFHTAVYIEIHGTEADASEQLEKAGEILEECGGNVEDTWMAMDSREMERLKFFRHAVPEAVNLEIDRIRKKYPRVTKLGTDMSVPDNLLDDVIDMYNTDLVSERLQSVIFGHIGNNHLHVNIIPQNELDYLKGKALYIKWAQRVAAMGGSVSAEHGIGKIKTEFLKIMYGEKGVQQMRDLKKLFDPKLKLNRGNLFKCLS